MQPDRRSQPDAWFVHDDDLAVQIDHLVIELGEGGGEDDEALAGDITAAVLASLGRLELEA